ncbi:MAG: prepilin-type N-terminal cleavage/methylation domain-containing protein [Armatimonadota bacterium]
MRRRGFTLVEAMLVSAVLALVASIVAPRLVAFQDSQRTLRDSQTIETFAERAHSAAISGRNIQVLSFDGDTNTLRYSPEEEGAGQTTGTTTGTSDPTEQKLLNTWSVSDVAKGSDADTTSEFSVRFFADGSAEATTASFKQNGVIFGLTVTKEGNVTVSRGAPAAQNNSEWEAGNLEQKGTA